MFVHKRTNYVCLYTNVQIMFVCRQTHQILFVHKRANLCFFWVHSHTNYVWFYTIVPSMSVCTQACQFMFFLAYNRTKRSLIGSVNDGYQICGKAFFLCLSKPCREARKNQIGFFRASMAFFVLWSGLSFHLESYSSSFLSLLHRICNKYLVHTSSNHGK